MKPLFLLIVMFSIYGLGFSQNVGISTLNPSFKLDVRNGSINTDSVYRIGTHTVLSVLGVNSLFVGQHAGNHNTGDDNTFSGAFSGHFNTDGFSNAFFGTGSGYNNTTGLANSFFGAYTGFYSTTGRDNSFFGTDVGALNTTGSANSFFGRASGVLNTTGRSNSFFGTFAGYSNSTGNNNSFYGDSTGFKNTTGTDNTFMGLQAGYFNTSGNSNSFFGKWAGFGNSTGYSNSFFGQKAGEINSSGFENSIFGFYSGPDNTSGFENSFFGTFSGYQNSTGSKNSFLGKYAGYGNTTGTSNTAIGYSSFFNSGALTNATAIGNNARVDCSNCMVLGSVTNVNNAPSGVNVGIGVNSPSAKLSISSYGVELEGAAASSLFRTNAGILGSMANDEMSIANIGFASLNNSSLGITAYRRVPGSNWMSTSLLLEYDVDQTARVNSSYISLNANGNIGIGMIDPAFKLDVANGSINTDSDYRIGTLTVLAVPGTGNLFIGKYAGFYNIGTFNTFCGDGAGNANNVGGINSFFGQSAGANNTSGFLNTALGANANFYAGDLINATAIGANARVDCSNCLVLGSSQAPVKVGIGTTNPDASAVLDVASTSKGFLPPRMTKAERDAIPAPVAGLMVWCTNCGALGQIHAFNGWNWTNLSPTDIGQFFQGGIIGYELQPGDPGYDPNVTHGLIVSGLPDAAAQWGCMNTYIGGTSTILGAGPVNTTIIVTACGTPGIAARLCDEQILNGYSDWYLPSLNELKKLYLNKTAIGGFEPYSYWSSTEKNGVQAWYQDFEAGATAAGDKTFLYAVRAIRSF